MENPPQLDLNAPPNGHIFAQLRKTGLRPTSARICVLQVLQANDSRAYFAEEVFIELVDIGVSISLGTVYRVLNELAQSHLVVRELVSVDTAVKTRFMVAPAVAPPLSYTVVCRACHREMPLADKALTDALHRQARAGGFDLQLTTLTLSAICNACAAKANQPT